MRDIAQVILVAAVVAGCGLAQETTKEKHVKDIKAEQTQDVISASTACQQARANGHPYDHIREVNPATLAADLSALMQKSDEVVIGGVYLNETNAISPSGEDVVQYFDVMVLRSWKGSHKVGDILTFAVPWAGVYCGLGRPRDAPSLVASTRTRIIDWKGMGSGGPYVLFLRRSQGDEAQLIPGLRLAGGDGLQGLFPVKMTYDKDCTGILPGSMAKCNAVLDAIQEPISVQYRLDPLKKKYDGMPASSFLKEVQSVAESLGYAGQSGSAK